MGLPTIFHVTSESAHIRKVGGLGDVVHGLTNALTRLNYHTAVIIPKYPDIPLPHTKYLKLDGVQIWTAKHEGVTFYLIENKDLFDRDRVYGYKDDLARFLFFAKAAAKFLLHMDAKIAHLHDWPTAFIAALLKNTRVKTLLTIHNLFHQGTAPQKMLSKYELEEHAEELVSLDRINFLRSGIVTADLLNTVSPTYAHEILSPPLACNLENELRERQDNLTGILNGIDTTVWNPRTDSHLETPYDSETMARGKKENRKELSHYFGMPESDAPLVAAVARFDIQKGPELIAHAIKKTREMGGQFVFIGVPSGKQMEHLLEKTKKQWGADPNVHVHDTFNERLAHLAYASADFVIIPSLFEPCGLTQLLAMRYGGIPIARNTGGLADTINDNVNGFLFDEATKPAFSEALARAFALSKTKKAEMARRGMQCNMSWDTRVPEYIALYEKLYC